MAETENTDSITVTPSASPGSKKIAIDLEALAERIFRLMKEEARIQQERQCRRNKNHRKVSHGR
jgi:50S ribosomal subunit-associated GTPase HflX